jgi:hypothetical protein
VNYYLKSETYTKSEVQQLIDAVKQFTYQSVSELPAASADTMNKIYLVPSTNPDTRNVKDEYITISVIDQGQTTYSWEQIGSTTIDLSGYYTSAQTDTAISNALDSYSTTQQMNAAITAALNTALADYSTTSQTGTMISTAVTTALAAYYNKTEIDSQMAQKEPLITNMALKGFGKGTCSTAAATAAKTVTISNFLLLTNCIVTVYFQYAVGVSGATLNVSDTGAKPIMINGVTPQPGVIPPKSTVMLQYDGTNWNVISIQQLDLSFSPDYLFVDMGLPSGLMWAKRNIDVTQPNGFSASEFQYECSFFSWGNIECHNPISTSKFDYDFGTGNDGPYASTPGAALTGDASLSYDAARINCGAPWRLPTTSEFAELFNNIDYINANGDVIDPSQTNKLVTVNGIVGIFLKSKVNGNRLFFPCSGYGYGTSWDYRGANGRYWSSSLYSATNGLVLYFNSGGVRPQYNNGRFNGLSGRAVQ